MSDRIVSIPELLALDSRSHQVRIPPQVDVPLSDRVRRVIDTAPFRRLAAISQLGLVAQVYPGARHSRFEHSLGVYRTALLYLKRLAHDARFRERVTVRQAELFLVTALLHDIGHWPFCHPIEDLQLDGIPRHEELAGQLLATGELSGVLLNDWGIDPMDVIALLTRKVHRPGEQLILTMLSGPIDVDKVDYLQRDSLHAGVPYGRNFDSDRLIGSLCLNAEGNALALAEKGCTAAEMMVFARYVMFSEVYWHHTVRSATAMFQRAFFLLRGVTNPSALVELTEVPLIEALRDAASGLPAGELLDGLFGRHRCLYKRVLELSALQHADLHAALSRRPYEWLIRASEEVANRLRRVLGGPVPAHHVLLDAPPRKLEVQFNVDIYFGREGQFRPLHHVSPIVHTLASDQFDRMVKRVRLLVHPALRERLRGHPQLDIILREVVQACDR